jgi:hypothetical protein
MSSRKTSIIQEVLVAAQSQRESLQLSKDGLLIDSLQQAMNSLSTNFEYDDPFSPSGGDSADYFNMFESVATNFAQLGKALLKMRSTYLPVEMIDDELGKMRDPGTGTPKKISEIIDGDTTLESYENTFFRLLGMPSTADIRDKSLITVTQGGKKLPWSDDTGFFLTNKVLEKRASPVGDRIDHPNNTAYDFLSGVAPSIDRLINVGFSKTKELAEILAKIRELSLSGRNTSTDLAQANSLISLMNNHRAIEKEGPASPSRNEIEEVNHLRVIFGENPPKAPSSEAFLERMLNISLGWLEPLLVSKITTSMKKHLWNEHVKGTKNTTLLELQNPSNFWSYSYLLFPPVQDGRIATCINEPSKMVAEPFLPESMRTVNGHKLESTLLEAVIRIRLDTVSGFPQKAARLNRQGNATSTEGDERVITPDEMGLLEALLIVRLFSALHGFARDVNKKVKTAWWAQQRSKRSPSAEPNAESGDSGPAPTDQKFKSKKQLELESLLLVEESLLLLFGDGSVPDALDAQEGVARNSGVKRAHLMSAALSVLDVPKRWAEQELGKIKEVESRASEKDDAPATGGLRQQLGMAKGVGSLDLLAYLIALFTAKEEVLLALLNDKQYGNLKGEYPADFFLSFNRSAIDTGRAVNKIAERAFDAYQLFRFMLTEEAPKFRHPELTSTR